MYINIFMCTYIQIHARSKLHTKFTGFAFMCSMFSIAFTFSKRCVYASRACTISNTHKPKTYGVRQSRNDTISEREQTRNDANIQFKMCKGEAYIYLHTNAHKHTHLRRASDMYKKNYVYINGDLFERVWQEAQRAARGRRGKNIRKRRLKIQKLN